MNALRFSTVLLTALVLASCASPPPSGPAFSYHVAPDGSDAGDGSRARPFASLERARDAIRTLRTGRGYPIDGVSVVVHGGRYSVTNTFTLGPQDACASNQPIVFRAADGEKPVFSGGVRLKNFSPVAEDALLARLPEEARGKVLQCDLKAAGIAKLEPLVLGGAYSGRGNGTHALHEVYCNGKPLAMARWPNDDFVKIVNIDTNAAFVRKGKSGSADGTFTYEGDRPARWVGEKDAWLYGYWFWDWGDSYEKIANIDTQRREIDLQPPFHHYGFRKGQTYYAINVFAEIDQPGEYVIDRERGLLFVWPPEDPKGAVYELSVFTKPFVEVKSAANIRFEGLTWELGAGDAFVAKACDRLTLAGCTVRSFGGEAVQLSGTNGTVRSCDIYQMGRGGVHLSGGNRRTLAPGHMSVENCDIHDLSRINHTYTPAVLVDGVGNRVANCLLHDIASSAIRLGGNDHLVESNEIARTVLESDDQGAAELFGDPTFRGNIFRRNFIHHTGSRWAGKSDAKLGQAGIRFDDAISGQTVSENVFWHTGSGSHGFGAVQIHGGKDNLIASNVFADCDQAISFSPWRSAARWNEWIAKYTNQVDMKLYTERYPGLGRLHEGIDTNFVRFNLVVNCPKFLHRGRAETNGNIIVTNALPLADILRRPDAPTVELERIGLQRDAWRRELPFATLRRLRAD